MNNKSSHELDKKAKALGLPTSKDQVLPDADASDQARNISPYDVDDRLFAAEPFTPEQIRNGYLIGFVSNAKEMNKCQIKRALESILTWMEVNDKTQNLGYLKTIINDL